MYPTLVDLAGIPKKKKKKKKKKEGLDGKSLKELLINPSMERERQTRPLNLW